MLKELDNKMLEELDNKMLEELEELDNNLSETKNPNLNRQKTFIIENSNILNREIKIAILSIIMMEIGPSVIMDSVRSKGLNINLDAIGEINPDILNHIYNIVKTRIDTLNQPAKHI